jgi:hypothetical protein
MQRADASLRFGRAPPPHDPSASAVSSIRRHTANYEARSWLISRRIPARRDRD